jgi:hypothetical protein
MRFSSAVSTALEDNDISSKALVCSIDGTIYLAAELLLHFGIECVHLHSLQTVS